MTQTLLSNTMFKNAVWDLQNDMPIMNTYTNLKNTDNQVSY
jgi:hypothetical protein